MIQNYRIPTKMKEVTVQQIMRISEESDLKDAIHNKSILKIKMLIMKNSNINDETLGYLWTIS